MMERERWMSNPTKPLEDLVKELSPGLRDEVEDFVEFLVWNWDNFQSHGF
jgi:hypothetical protein